MSIEDEDFDYSDEEIDESKHQSLVDDVIGLNKVQRLKKPTRTEPALKISEFDLVKSSAGKKGSVYLNDLSSLLSDRRKHLLFKKKLEKVEKHAKTLPKPLEKPVAERIRRTVAYEKTRLELDRWEPIVTSNRVSTNLSFPLKSQNFEEDNGDEKRFKLKTIFDEEKEKINPSQIEEIHVDVDKTNFPLSMEEIMEHRKQEAKLRAQQSYKEAKARRQNKIKSKSYHRILRREKIKQQLKEFELLQKSNPEEALKKLDEIERTRAQERFSLRHKSTGKWAKNKQIRAKYDKESRQELAQQLTLSKELTQKINAESDSEGELDMKKLDEESSIKLTKKDNPWQDGIKVGSEVADFVNNYKKYWSEKNMKIAENEEKDEKSQNKFNEDEILNLHDDLSQDIITTCDNIGKDVEAGTSLTEEQSQTDSMHIEEKLHPKKRKKSRTSKKSKRKSEKGLNSSLSTSDWDVEFTEGEGIDVVFDKIEKNFEQKLQKKLNKIQKELSLGKPQDKKNKKPLKADREKPSLLTMPIQKKRPQIDEPLAENFNNEVETMDSELKDLKDILNKIKMPNENKIQKNNDVGTSQTKKVEINNLNTDLPDISTNADEDDLETNPAQNEVITEAFEDNLFDEFAKEKSDTVEKEKPKDINLTLPGWGSWGGAGILPSKRKRRRFIVKAPKKIPRRDDNKGFLIINEDAGKKLKEHMVNEVPFPFQRVRDFEASIRVPIGRTFVPETAFQKLIKPAVRTKAGAVIEPMDKDVLLRLPS